MFAHDGKTNKIIGKKSTKNFNKEKNFKESDSLGGLDNYSSSKASAEMIFSSYFNNYFKKKKIFNCCQRKGWKCDWWRRYEKK